LFSAINVKFWRTNLEPISRKISKCCYSTYLSVATFRWFLIIALTAAAFILNFILCIRTTFSISSLRSVVILGYDFLFFLIMNLQLRFLSFSSSLHFLHEICSVLLCAEDYLWCLPCNATQPPVLLLSFCSRVGIIMNVPFHPLTLLWRDLSKEWIECIELFINTKNFKRTIDLRIWNLFKLGFSTKLNKSKKSTYSRDQYTFQLIGLCQTDSNQRIYATSFPPKYQLEWPQILPTNWTREIIVRTSTSFIDWQILILGVHNS